MHMTTTDELAPVAQSAFTMTLKKIADSAKFQNFIVGIIFVSTFLIGLETQPIINEYYMHIIYAIEEIIIGIFVIELLIRIGAHGQKFWQFFYNRWNVFDFIIVVVCLLPTAQYAAVLRLVRILRILRLIDSIQKGELHRLKNIELSHAYDTLAQKNSELERAYHQLEEEKAKSEWLLLNILPNLVAQRLKSGAKVIADSHDSVTVMFADIVGFTQLSSKISPEALVAILDAVFRRFDHLVDKFKVEKIKTIGDAYMIVSGVPEDRSDHQEAIANLALEMLDTIADYNQESGQQLSIRIGFFSGPVVAGVIGQKKFVYDLWGDTVNTASRMESQGEPGKIQVAENTYLTLKDHYEFEPRSKIDVKGKGEMMTYFLLGRKTDVVTSR